MTQSINIYCNVDLSDTEYLVSSFAEHRKISDLLKTLSTGDASITVKCINTGHNLRTPKSTTLNKSQARQQVRTRTKKYLDKIHCMIWVAKAVIASRRETVHVFYNLPPHYWLAIILGYILGRKLVFDIEDFPTVAPGQIVNNSVNRLSRTIIKFPVDLKICASVGFSDQIGGRTLVYYGHLPRNDLAVVKKNKKYIGIHFGGHVDTETGLTEFIELIQHFKQYRGSKKIKLFATGNTTRLANLAYQNQFSELIVHPNMPTSELEKLLQHDIHIGLSLKKPNGLYGSTTFPSKIVNYWKHDILVASTDVIDMKLNFSKCYIPLTSDGAKIYKVLVDLINDEDFFQILSDTKVVAQNTVRRHESIAQHAFRDLN